MLDYLRMSQEQQGPMSPARYGNPAYGGDYNAPMSPIPQERPGLAGPEEGMPQPQREAPRKEPAMGSAASDVTQGANPIANGARNALESTRASLELTEDQRRRAMGDALMGFFGNFAASKNPTALGSLAESVPAGLQAWNAAEAEHRAINLAGLNRADMLENRDWDRAMKERQYGLLKQKEERLRQQAGKNAGLKPGNQIALSKAYSDAYIGRERAYKKRVDELVGSFAPENRTPELIREMEAQAESEMAPYDKNIQNIKNTAISLGWDVENNIPITDTSGYLTTKPDQGSNQAFIASDGTIMDEEDEDELYNILFGG